ncbi:hypothetical protein GGS24DRAFT_499701 [Hypoxylon argillaceum]|nr:hypothetical protein GGS24DRAFT_499701 [Hypoxylon argillaceum]KAI1153841.1 hypothetical protein F4825DRAFT_449047 [Nemania diffusa]
MATCKFKWENETCDNPPFRWDLCEDHYNLRTETHEYYKATENEYNGIKRNESDEDRFEQRHKWLLLTIAARDIHTELFFKGSPSYEHEEYVKHLHWKMQEEENVIYMRGKGFIVEGASFDDMLSVAKASMRQACFDWVRSDKTKGLGQFIQNFPRAIVSGNTVPDTVLRRRHPWQSTGW